MLQNIIAGLIASASVTATPHDVNEIPLICAYDRPNGWVLEGTHATFTDWAANQVIGEAIGDGNCQTGWSMATFIDQRIPGVMPTTSRTVVSGGLDTVTVTVVDAGRKTSAYNGEAPAVLKGQRGGAGDKWRLVQSDGNGGGIYRVVRSGNTSRPRGTELLFDADMLMARDNQSGDATVNEYWQRNYRYDAVRDVTTTDTSAVYRTVTIKHTHVSCPPSYEWAFISPDGSVSAVTKGEVKPCVTKTRTSTQSVLIRPASTTVETGEKYIPN